jgi:threonine aldolase
VGSVVCGNTDFIREARRARKVLGGGMRQAGVLAAAGVVALREMVDRLAEDHANARRLAEGLSAVSGLKIDPAHYQTNIVYFDVATTRLNADQLVAALQDKGVRMLATGPRSVRAVTHYEVTAKDIDYALATISNMMKR